MSLSDRIALFNEGRIEQIGSPESLYNTPETLFVARFLGDSNVFPLSANATGASVSWEGERWAGRARHDLHARGGWRRNGADGASRGDVAVLPTAPMCRPEPMR